MEKVINLKSDRVFRHAVRLVENKNYCTRPDIVQPALRNLAIMVTNRISVLSKRGKLDATDLKIIAMRQRTPIPTWRETSQRAFLADPGAPGGFTLFKSPHEKYHIHFAEQIVAERLVNKYETDNGIRWEWAHQPGSEWDWGDALTGCWVAAAASGLSASGQPAVQERTMNRRRMRHIKV